MLSARTSEHKQTTVLLEKVHPADLLQREERIATDPATVIDLGIGEQARQYIQSPQDLDHFLTLAEEAGDGLSILEQPGLGVELLLYKWGRTAELGSYEDLVKGTISAVPLSRGDREYRKS
jgi:hypothetical protein